MLKLLIVALFAGCSLGAVVNSGSEAAALVMETILTDFTNKEVRSLDQILESGEIMGAWSYPGIMVPFDSYLVLVDDYAYANWAHPCRWVFVSPQGEMEVVRNFVPRMLFPGWLWIIHVSRTRAAAAVSTRISSSGSNQMCNPPRKR